MRKTKPDVTITNCTFNGATHGVKLDEITGETIKALAQAVEANAHAISAIVELAKGGDSYGLYLAGKPDSEKH